MRDQGYEIKFQNQTSLKLFFNWIIWTLHACVSLWCSTTMSRPQATQVKLQAQATSAMHHFGIVAAIIYHRLREERKCIIQCTRGYDKKCARQKVRAKEHNNITTSTQNKQQRTSIILCTVSELYPHSSIHLPCLYCAYIRYPLLVPYIVTSNHLWLSAIKVTTIQCCVIEAKLDTISASIDRSAKCKVLIFSWKPPSMDPTVVKIELEINT